MKRFTQISNKEEIIRDEPKTLQLELKKIVESSLNISIEGDLEDYLTKNIGIDGKDKLVESLFNYFEDISSKNITTILEKVKYQGLDNVILEHQTPSKLKVHKTRIESLLLKKDVIESAKHQASTIKDGEKAHYRSIAAEQMIVDQPKEKKNLKEIRDIFSFRSKALGYRKYG
jgi:D-hexose-6-phosphate mutarotase